MANGLAHSKDLLPSSSLILEWSSMAHTGQIPRRQKVAGATGGLRSLSPCPAGQIAVSGCGKGAELLSWQDLSIKEKTAPTSAANLGRERDYQPSPRRTFTILIPHQEPGRGSPEVIAKDAINLYLIFIAAAQLLRKCRAGSRNWVMFKDLRWPGPIALRGQASEKVLLGTASMAGEEWVP